MHLYSVHFILGESFESLQYLYCVPAQTIGQIIPETCQAIVDKLQQEYMKVNRPLGLLLRKLFLVLRPKVCVRYMCRHSW